MDGEIRAYVFIECDRDPMQIVRQVQKLEGVRQAHALFGPLDAIAYLEVEDLKTLEERVLQIQKIPGVRSTDTRIARVE